MMNTPQFSTFARFDTTTMPPAPPTQTNRISARELDCN
jgi:hypothetical protein